MRFLNFTKHDVVLNGQLIKRANSKGARVKEVRTPTASVDGITVFRGSYSSIVGLPSTLEPDTFYIVSRPVAEMAKHPQIVVTCGHEVDSNGNITNTKSVMSFE